MTTIESLINRQILKWELEKGMAESRPEESPREVPLIITISRQAGSRGSYLAKRLADRLKYQRLHREVIDMIADSSGFRKRIIESLDHQNRGGLDLAVEGMIRGQLVDHSDYTRHLCKVVLSMAQLGGVILLGRAGNFILGPERGFHLRVVCPKPQRIKNLEKYRGLNAKEAERLIEETDKERREFVGRLFHADIDDPEQYDLVINTALLDIEDLLQLTETAFTSKVNKLRHRPQE